MARTSLALLIALSGCSKGFEGGDTVNGGVAESDADTDADSDADADADGDPAIDEDLPDVTEAIDEDVCTEYLGATSYFYGAYTREGDDWYGEEKWLLFANEQWEAEGGADCEVVWNTVAVEGLVGACVGCDFSLTISATVDQGRTTCDPAIAGGAPWTETYDIDTVGEQASVYYHDSGTYLGAGYANDDTFNFLSDVSCLAF